MKEVSVNRKGSSLRLGHGVERRASEEVSLSFCKGGGGEEDDEETESSKVSAIWRTNGSESVAYGVKVGRIEIRFLVLVLVLVRVTIGVLGVESFERGDGGGAPRVM